MVTEPGAVSMTLTMTLRWRGAPWRARSAADIVGSMLRMFWNMPPDMASGLT